MLIRLLQINFSSDDIYEDAKYLSGFKTDNYGEFMKMLSELKNNSEEFNIAVGEEWYTIDTYVFSFPKDSDSLPCINIYVI